MKRSTVFWLLILAALLLALLVEMHTGHLGHLSLFMAGVGLLPSTPALPPATAQIERVLTVYSDNPPSRNLLMTRDEAEQYAKGVTGQYLTVANSGHGGTVTQKPATKHGVSCLKILAYRMDDFPAHPGVGRVLVVCERI
jgi:hypothetical protein